MVWAVNLTLLERAGMGVQISLRKYTEERIQAEIARVADDPSYKENARHIQAIICKTEGAKNAADEILDFFKLVDAC